MSAPSERARSAARCISVTGIVQGVGFRPFVYRLATTLGLAGWVANSERGVEIMIEGPPTALETFLSELVRHPPPAARIDRITVEPTTPRGLVGFVIRESRTGQRPTTRVSPDLAVCEACLRELFDPRDRRYLYPYVNCTDCGPRYSIVLSLPYDRPRTTMKDWPLCPDCAREYHDPTDRRFHAQPIACPICGPQYVLHDPEGTLLARGQAAIREAAALLRTGRILAVKGIGGYHLTCDARDATAVQALRERKFRKEKPFALMVASVDVASTLVELDEQACALLSSPARPIVLLPALVVLPGVAPDSRELGIMLPYAPLHFVLFAAGAPEVLVMTSGNRSDEPIAYCDTDAFARLGGIADAFLVGERPIARRVDDSVIRMSRVGPIVIRRARGLAPAAVATLPSERPIVAVGADLKNAITLVVDGQAIVSQHLGDLDHWPVVEAFEAAIRDLCTMYEIQLERALVVHDAHPGYVSTSRALTLPGEHRAVQHHRAHVASVLAERGAWSETVVGLAFDGTGYGDDGTIWGGEVFVGSLSQGFQRVAHLRPSVLPGGDAAARWPVQAAAGFLAALGELPDLLAPPFSFPDRFSQARQLVARGVQCFPTTSMGRLFDTVAALCGFTRPTSFEGQAAMWLEHLAQEGPPVPPYPFPLVGSQLDFRPLLEAVIADRKRGRQPTEIARAFHEAVAVAAVTVAAEWCAALGLRTVVASGGVFQNALLLARMAELLQARGLELWTNRAVPPNDGGISLGQAALAACASSTG
ncbi:MAG: carbamoyltransferase HypF [Thermomicrobium sp.]|nr:carbamoyltransferase HypF [Thermomicrobium sp.]